MIRLSDESMASWRSDRIVHLRGVLHPDEIQALRRWSDELRDDRRAAAWSHYYESESEDRGRLCRVEDFVPHHEGLRSFFARADLLQVLEGLLAEPAVLFKEKINYKLPGGDGFRPHQDAPAFEMFEQSYHATVMLGLDAATRANGCLDVVRGFRRAQRLDQREDGTLAEHVVDALVWEPLETDAGDIVVFDSYVPHRSGPNRSDSARRAFYVTYNRISDGDRRNDYFALKREAFPTEAERTRKPDSGPHPARHFFNLGNPIR